MRTEPDTDTCHVLEIPEGPYIYITIKELGPKIPYYRRNYGSQSLMVVYVDPLGMVSHLLNEQRPEHRASTNSGAFWGKPYSWSVVDCPGCYWLRQSSGGSQMSLRFRFIGKNSPPIMPATVFYLSEGTHGLVSGFKYNHQ